MEQGMTKPQTACAWKETDDGEMSETSCGNALNVEAGTPRENGMMFCCYCGKHLDQRRYIPMMDEEEPEAMNAG